MTKRIWVAGAAFLFMAAGACKGASRAASTGGDDPPAGTRIALLYSSNLIGEYEPCG